MVSICNQLWQPTIVSFGTTHRQSREGWTVTEWYCLPSRHGDLGSERSFALFQDYNWKYLQRHVSRMQPLPTIQTNPLHVNRARAWIVTCQVLRQNSRKRSRIAEFRSSSESGAAGAGEGRSQTAGTREARSRNWVLEIGSRRCRQIARPSGRVCGASGPERCTRSRPRCEGAQPVCAFQDAAAQPVRGGRPSSSSGRPCECGHGKFRSKMRSVRKNSLRGRRNSRLFCNRRWRPSSTATARRRAGAVLRAPWLVVCIESVLA